MYSFRNDYSEGAHEKILSKLSESSLVQAGGYGEDSNCEMARQVIKQKIGRSDVDVHFIPGGTQTNLIAMSAFLRPHEAVVSAATGHIEVHETGAIEATGHKIISIETADGKLSPELLQPALLFHDGEHMVKPRMVYISDTTELGTTYTKAQIEQLSQYCKQNDLLLFLDGARLGSALCTADCDITLSDVANNTDAFYISGTKNGALFGEALVICNDALKADFRYHMKQKGGLLAKGSVLGLQFLALFEDDLFFELARHANEMAAVLRAGVAKAGFSFMSDSTSNQLFPIFPNWLVEKLREQYDFLVIKAIDEEHSCVRLVTSWATERQAAADFIDSLNKLSPA